MLKRLTKLLPVALLSLTLVIGVLHSTVQAGSPQELACDGAGGTWSGSECINPEDQGGSLTDVITAVVNTILYIVGIVAVVMIIVGGFRYVVSNGDSAQISAAKSTITYAVVGLIVAAAAFAIVNFVLERL